MRAPLLLFVFALLSSPVAASTDHASRHYHVTGRPDLRLVAGDGHVQIRPGPAGEIQIDVETEGWRIGTNALRIVDSQDGNQVSFELKEPHHWGIGFSFEIRKRITITAVVPPDLDLSVVTGDGSVEVGDLRGRLQIHTGDGHLVATNLRGKMDLEAGDGNIEALGVEGQLSGRTGDGHIRVEGRFESLRVHSGDGPVLVVVDAGSKVTDEWLLSTGDGTLTLRVPRDLRADLEATTGDGHISSDLPITMSGNLNGRSLHGRLNGGGGALTLHTGDGSIRIEER
jgi:putative adhesin